jgi:hypothetical protein
LYSTHKASDVIGTEREIGTLSITPAGKPGETAFVKIDAAVLIISGGDQIIGARLVRSSDNHRSMNQIFREDRYAGAPFSLTWAVALPAGVPETFRVVMNAPVPCAVPTLCATFQTWVAISAVSAPLGAHGGDSLQ